MGAGSPGGTAGASSLAHEYLTWNREFSQTYTDEYVNSLI